jgi:hypothetical protein
MKTTITLPSLVVCLLVSFMSTALAQEQKALPPKYDEADLKKCYDNFLLELNYVQVATDHPKVIKDLLSGDSARQLTAVKTLGETAAPVVIPWLVPFLDSEDVSLRIWAGSSIDKVISAGALKRRDPTQPDRVVLRPLEAGELDLRPFAWVALKMFRKPDDGNTHAYAASVTRYLEVREFENELRHCLWSRHPAIAGKARWALESLGLEKASGHQWRSMPPSARWTSREVAAVDSVEGQLMAQGKRAVRTTGPITVRALVQDMLEGRLDQPKGRGAIGKVLSVSTGDSGEPVAVVDFGRDYSPGIYLSELSPVVLVSVSE